MKVSTRKLALAAGVSPATVSRYLNGTEEVSRELAEKIESTLHQMGCEEIVRKDGRKIIMVLVTHLRFSFYSKAVSELFDLKKDNRHSFVLLQYDPAAPESIKAFVSRMKPIGAIYFEEEIDNTILQYLQGAGVRTVMCGGVALNHESDMVHVNDIMAAYDGTNYLLNLGHRDILILSDDVKKIGAGFQRIAGCRKAMEERSLPLPSGNIICGALTFEAGHQAVQNALANKVKFTAIFAFSDELAVGAMAALYDAGLSVPKDVSILGYDDLSIASKIRPRLTTIHQPIDGFVKKSLDIIEQPTGELSSEILLQHSIVERESCRRI